MGLQPKSQNPPERNNLNVESYKENMVTNFYQKFTHILEQPQKSKEENKKNHNDKDDDEDHRISRDLRDYEW